MKGKVLKRGLESGQQRHRVGLAVLDLFEDLDDGRDVDHGVGAVHLVGVDSDGRSGEEEDVLQFGELGGVAEALLLRFACEVARVLVADDVRDELVDETLATDLVEVREKLKKAGESEAASCWISSTKGTEREGRIVVDGVEHFLGDSRFLDAAVELRHQWVGLRTFDDAAAHLTDDPVPACVEQIDSTGVACRRRFELMLDVDAVDVGVAATTGSEEARCVAIHLGLDLLQQRERGLSEIGDLTLSDLYAGGDDCVGAEVLEGELLHRFRALRLDHHRRVENRAVGHLAEHAVVEIDQRVDQVAHTPDGVERAVAAAVAEEHERLFDGLVFVRVLEQEVTVAVLLTLEVGDRTVELADVAVEDRDVGELAGGKRVLVLDLPLQLLVFPNLTVAGLGGDATDGLANSLDVPPGGSGGGLIFDGSVEFDDRSVLAPDAVLNVVLGSGGLPGDEELSEAESVEAEVAGVVETGDADAISDEQIDHPHEASHERRPLADSAGKLGGEDAVVPDPFLRLTLFRDNDHEVLHGSQHVVVAVARLLDEGVADEEVGVGP